jgi:NAD(P)-dependent dehydrogenase (short-subunit alcohol dehydrogenase family)
LATQRADTADAGRELEVTSRSTEMMTGRQNADRDGRRPTPPEMRLRDKVALVTGAASGIGRACALSFAREGAMVVAADVNGPGVEATVASIAASGRSALALVVDVSSEQSVGRCFQAIDERNLLADVVMNCAGFSTTADGPLHGVPSSVWDRVVGINLTGTYFVCRSALDRLVKGERAGSLINVAARAALNGIDRHAYAAAKGGVAALSRSIGVTYATHDIRCNAIAPGMTETEMTRYWTDEPSRRAAAVADVPMRRFGQSAEIAELGVYLASDESSFVTATVIPIDGGRSAY